MKNLATAIATSGHLIEQNKQGLSVEDVFSTYLYTGTGAVRDIVNGIDLATEGGLVWCKARTITREHTLVDTLRGATKELDSGSSAAETTDLYGVTGFNTDGFSLNFSNDYNVNSYPFVSWTFRKAPRFFDVVTYTGNGVAGREIAHDLGCDVGMIIVKCTSAVENWEVQHKSIGGTEHLKLNLTDASAANAIIWNNTSATDTVFTVGDNGVTNGNTQEYIAYLFADDPDGPSGDGSDGLIACGSLTADGVNETEVDLGWEPQFLLAKWAGGTDNWEIIDTMRGFVTGGDEAILNPNLSNAEAGGAKYDLTATGFKKGVSGAGREYIYMAIRRPMRTPESSDEVFAINAYSGNSVDYRSISTIITSDLALVNNRTATDDRTISSRLTDTTLYTSDINAEIVNYYVRGWDSMNTLDVSQNGKTNQSGNNYVGYFLKRATGFFDVVAYEGDGLVGRTVDHNLGVVPEMIWVKCRSNINTSWVVYHKTPGAGKHLKLQDDGGESAYSYFNSTEPAADVFTIGNHVDDINGSTKTYIAYLFATLAGISKVGSYTGNGTSQTIDCGFSGGAKFVLIKRTDNTGDWFFWDSVRGIVAGNDPHLSLNTTVAEVTSDDSIDPDSTGFIVNQVAATNINVNSAEYIFYAIA